MSPPSLDVEVVAYAFGQRPGIGTAKSGLHGDDWCDDSLHSEAQDTSA
jgi:hypothetical protein